MMTYIAATFALLFCITVICTIILRAKWKDKNDRLDAECVEKLKQVEYLSKQNQALRQELSKKTVKCRKCGQFHKARKEILGGAMPGETLCGENKCKVYG